MNIKKPTPTKAWLREAEDDISGMKWDRKVPMCVSAVYSTQHLDLPYNGTILPFPKRNASFQQVAFHLEEMYVKVHNNHELLILIRGSYE